MARTLEDLLCGLHIDCTGGAMHAFEHLVEVGEIENDFLDDGKYEVSDYFDPYGEDSGYEDDWSDQESEDFWYGSTTEDEEDEEYEEDPLWPVERFEGLLPVSPWSEDSAPPASSLSSTTKRSREESDTLQVSAKRQRTCEDSNEDPRPSTSGLSSTTKRSREESNTGQVSVKRQRTCEDSNEDPRPSTSGLSSTTYRRYSPSPLEHLGWSDDSDSDED